MENKSRFLVLSHTVHWKWQVFIGFHFLRLWGFLYFLCFVPKAIFAHEFRTVYGELSQDIFHICHFFTKQEIACLRWVCTAENTLWFGWGNYLDWACRRQDTWHPLTSKAADHKQNNDHLLISLKDMQLFHVKNTCFYCMFPWTLKYNSIEEKRKKRRQAWRTQVCPKRELTSGCLSQKIPYCKGKCWSLPACLHCGSRWGRTQPKAAMGLSALGEKSDNKLKPS